MSAAGTLFWFLFHVTGNYLHFERAAKSPEAA